MTSRRLLALALALVAMFAAWLTTPAAAAVASVSEATAVTYSYDGQRPTSDATRVVSERGPPTRRDGARCHAVGRGSPGAPAYPDGPPRGSTTTYTTPVQLVHVARLMARPGGQGQVADVGFSAFERLRVAANDEGWLASRLAARNERGAAGLPGRAHSELNAAGRGVDAEHVWANGDLYTQVRGGETRLIRVLSRGNGQNDVVIRELNGDPVTSMVISDESLAARIADGRWQ